MGEVVLRADNLVKEYNSVKAVNGISFEIKAGEIVGLLGPNGAGKTTTINMVLSILEPTVGKIEKFGNSTNFAAVYAHPPQNLSVYQNLKIFGLLYGVKNLNQTIKNLLKEFDLENYKKTNSGLLSSGELSRLSLAKATMNSPKLLLLDEPTASLDPHIAMIIREKIRDYVKKINSAILWTSHNMYEIEDVCNKVMFLSHGKILLEGDPKKLPAQYGKKNLEELFISVAKEPLSFEDDN